ALYHHFQGKPGLFEAVFEELERQAGEHIRPLVALALAPTPTPVSASEPAPASAPAPAPGMRVTVRVAPDGATAPARVPAHDGRVTGVRR
ncbi:hypothetical protein ABZ615_36390, partial [Streptomyces sp. NPDC007325]